MQYTYTQSKGRSTYIALLFESARFKVKCHVTALDGACLYRKTLCYMTTVEQLPHKGLMTNSQTDFLKSESSQSGKGRLGPV